MVKTSTVPALKTFAYAGVVLVAIGSLSSLYYAFVNQRFFQDVISLSYYLNYAIILFGGFVAGYAFTHRGDKLNKLYAGATFALMTMSLYTLMFALQLAVDKLFGGMTYPWTRIFFEGSSWLALGISVLVAYLTQLRSQAKTLTPGALRLFIGVYLAAQLYDIVSTIYWYSVGSGEDTHTPLLLTITGHLLTPLVISAVAYFSFGGIKKRINRLFAAAFIGIYSYTLGIVAWNFNTNPLVDAANVFQGFILIAMLCIDAFLIWKVRQTTK